MDIDEARVAEVLSRPHSYYGSVEPICRIDSRLTANTRDFIAAQFEAHMTVLDIGCGNGSTLISHAERFAGGVGIDPDPSHLADALTAAEGIGNLEFIEMDFSDIDAAAWAERFDLVFTERGPIGYSTDKVQAALSVVRPGGLLFAEVIGDLHHQQVRAVFGGAQFSVLMSVADQTRVAFSRAGVDIRVAADFVSKRYYPDIYEWLQFQCSIWAWSGTPFPAPNDVRLKLFAERNATADGEIETTHHVTWIGGVKPVARP